MGKGKKNIVSQYSLPMVKNFSFDKLDEGSVFHFQSPLTKISINHLINLKHREAWRVVVHGVAKSQTRLSDWTELCTNYSVIFRSSSWRDQICIQIKLVEHLVSTFPIPHPSRRWPFKELQSSLNTLILTVIPSIKLLKFL